ncbi:MAG TPA: polysaccharide biosynthesis protein [Nocardioides sp.]|uniref:lipopolysaccharide biosynthesis protein n=1 Tax=Nocardioides sp. TaxID=35761 RepID=UPI002B63AFFB|nr:oligosaccharide flippase family protein [Nocardioides sp.]HQR27795.1 polysaccharide biosynthesis protein [Nocardioides sp.]
MTSRTTAPRGLLKGGAVVAVAMGIMNVATYGFTMLAAYLLGPRAYGAFAPLMAALLVISVLQLGLQATAARRISADPEHVHQIERIILGVTYRGALVLGLVLVALSPLLNSLLRLGSLPTAALVGVAAVPLTVMGGQAGILQGERRWAELSLVYLAAGVPRLLFGLPLLLWRPTETSAMTAVTLGAFVPVLIGWYVLRDREAGRRVSEHHGARSVLLETVHNVSALFAFFALSNVDVIVARRVLDPHDAGLYAAGLILTKAVLFLPQFVVVVAFPDMASGESQTRRQTLLRSLVLVAALGAVCTLGALLLPDLALRFVGGAQYREIAESLWLFAVLGTILSMLQLLVYAVLARRGQRSVYLVWAALVALVVAGSQVTTLAGLIAVVLLVDGTLLALLLAVSLLVVRPSPDERRGAAHPVAGTQSGQ